jgi:hypothetical protein
MHIGKINIQHEWEKYYNIFVGKDFLISFLCKKFLQINKK